MSIPELKIEKEQKVSQLMKDSLLFFAFSNDQFRENKTPLQEGEKYVHIGAGGYLPKGKLDSFLDGMEQINKWYKDAIQSNKLREANILHELINHESFYIGDIEDAMSALGEGYTKEEVKKVYDENYQQQLL